LCSQYSLPTFGRRQNNLDGFLRTEADVIIRADITSFDKSKTTVFEKLNMDAAIRHW
jgi:hypothetical protein